MTDLNAIKKRIDSLIEQRQYQMAVKELLLLIDTIPDNAEIISRLGVTYGHLKLYDNALLCHERVLELRNDDPDALYNVAIAKLKLGRRQEAKQEFKNILALFPNHYHTLNNLGLMMTDLGDLQEAIDYFQKAISLNKQISNAHVNLAIVYKLQGEFGKAIVHLEMALHIPPVSANTYNNLANIYLQSCFHAKAQKMYQKAINTDPNLIYAQQNYLLSLHYTNKLTDEFIYRKHSEWGKQYEHLQKQYQTYNNEPIRNRRLRVGYVSGDFRKHPVGSFIQPVIKNHNRMNVEPYLYYCHNVMDTVTLEFMEMALTGWRDISVLNDDQAAELIRNERIDILVDLTGHTTDTRLGIFARKPAPVQIAYLGYPDTTGLSTIDYRLTDQYADPPENDSLSVEKLIRIPNSFLCASAIIETAKSLDKTLDPQADIVFGSFNMSSKINEKVIRLWAKILSSIPDSRFLLKSNAFSDITVVNRIKDMFSQEGINPERLDLHGRTPTYEEHLNLYNSVDIALDPYPYNGTTTTIEALCMNCPVITLVGSRHSSRVGYSILMNVGLQELITWCEDEYISTSISLAKDRKKLHEIKNSLSYKLDTSVLADTDGFIFKLENIYKNVWNTWCDTQQLLIAPKCNNLNNGFKILTPDSMQSLTSYVLHEQGDWYEKDDLAFLEKYLQPGDNAIDLGAGYGVYSINIAGHISDTGKLLSFEPSSSMVSYLKMSVQENQLTNITVYEAGISNKKTAAMLSIDTITEINKISKDETLSDNYEQICLLSLDNLPDLKNLTPLSLIKFPLDGEETTIFEGAKRTLEQESPLILYPISIGKSINIKLLSAFKHNGFACYKLIPGLHILVSIDTPNNLDPMLTNLYFCKPDLAAKLEARGLLCDEIQADVTTDYENESLANYFGIKECYKSLQKLWHQNEMPNSSEKKEHLDTIYQFIQSLDKSLSPSRRVGLLIASFSNLKRLAEIAPTIPRLLSLIRIASELGERAYATNVLKVVLDFFNSGEQISITEKHLAISKKFEEMSPNEKIGEWYLSSILDSLITSEFHTSFGGHEHYLLEYLEALQNLGFQRPEMKKRHQFLASKINSQY